jgi:hypothetical protein
LGIPAAFRGVANFLTGLSNFPAEFPTADSSAYSHEFYLQRALARSQALEDLIYKTQLYFIPLYRLSETLQLIDRINATHHSHAQNLFKRI